MSRISLLQVKDTEIGTLRSRLSTLEVLQPSAGVVVDPPAPASDFDPITVSVTPADSAAAAFSAMSADAPTQTASKVSGPFGSHSGADKLRICHSSCILVSGWMPGKQFPWPLHADLP